MKHLLVLALVAVAAIAKTDLEEVQDMLQALKNDIHEQILALDQQWQVTQQLKQANIQKIKDAKAERIKECDRRDLAIQEKQDEIQSTTEFIAWVQHRILVNKDRIAVLEDLQCKQSLNFIDTIRDDKLSVTASIFVKEQIARIISESTSFAQKTQAMRNILGFLQNLRENKYELLELQRSMELEVDEVQPAPHTSLLEMGPIELRKFNEAKDELLQALDELEKHVTEHIPVAQNNMIRVGIAFYEWKVRTLKENDVFAEKLEELAKLLQNLEDQLVALQHSAQLCRSSVGEFDTAVELAKQDAFLAFDKYTNDHDRLMKELAIFQEIYKMYDREIDNKTTEEEKEAISKRHQVQTVEEDEVSSESDEESANSEESSGEEESVGEENEGEDLEAAEEVEEFPEESAVDDAEEDAEEGGEEKEQLLGAEDTAVNSQITDVQVQASIEEAQEFLREKVEEALNQSKEAQNYLIENGPLKLRRIEEEKMSRSDFILLQIQNLNEEMDEVIL